MREKNKFIEDFIESKLSKSELKRTTGDFTKHLMNRITAENKALMEERKSDRIVKYAIGSFSFFMLAFTVVLGIVSKTASVTSPDSAGVGFDSVQTSNSMIETMVYYIQEFFVNILRFFGVTISSGTVTIMLVVILLVAVFLIGERFILKGKLRSRVQLK
jgi:hypothetical protein